MIFVLHAFSHNIHMKVLPHLHDRSNERRVVGIICHVTDKRLVDFQRADRKLLQRAQRRVAGAEIVNGEMKTK